jgi:hypothetical protein
LQKTRTEEHNWNLQICWRIWNQKAGIVS